MAAALLQQVACGGPVRSVALKHYRFALWVFLFAAIAFPVATATQDLPVNARVISEFGPGGKTRFGSLEFLGGIEFSSSDDRLESLSSIRFRADGERFVSVLDTGNWLTGRIRRDAQGRLSGLADVTVDPILIRGERVGSKYNSDAEGLALRDGQVLVSFEQVHRVDAYPDPGFEKSAPLRTLDLPIPRHEFRMNAGMETVAVSPKSGPLKGAPIAVTEHSLDDRGNLFAAILEGPQKGVFTVVRHDPYDATDGAFLPDGDFLLLERRFSFLGGLGMRIRRIKGEDIRSGATVNGEVLLEADMGYAIDNMEGLDVISGPEGKPHLILVSDDNGNMLQRNIMLEFRLSE
ncbi:esterase-like activity of phytase family protein [Rhizobium terrae]|uniref:esterase-like activity of phytase family protein n=1 Tax=Rhizobium terrae TaxID=2171756 RepID=UPI000E3C8B15|nr:esterase-like activity of phytase family protein [Rhizobium terrae]